MALTTSERTAIKSHALEIDKYERTRSEKGEDLWKQKRLKQPRKNDLPLSLSTARRKFQSFDDLLKVVFHRMNLDIEVELNAFDLLKKPPLTPWDTPAKLIGFIDEQSFNWSDRKTELLRINIEYTDEEALADHHAAAEKALRQVRTRLLSFAQLAPSIANDFPVTAQPIAAIDWCRAWCMVAMGNSPLAGDAINGLRQDRRCTPMSKTEMARRLGTQVRKLPIILKDHDLRQDGNRQTFSCDMTYMDLNMRTKLKHRPKTHEINSTILITSQTNSHELAQYISKRR